MLCVLTFPSKVRLSSLSFELGGTFTSVVCEWPALINGGVVIWIQIIHIASAATVDSRANDIVTIVVSSLFF